MDLLICPFIPSPSFAWWGHPPSLFGPCRRFFVHGLPLGESFTSFPALTYWDPGSSKPQLPPQAAPWPTHQPQPQQAPLHVWSNNFLHRCYLLAESWELWNLPSRIPWRCWQFQHLSTFSISNTLWVSLILFIVFRAMLFSDTWTFVASFHLPSLIIHFRMFVPLRVFRSSLVPLRLTWRTAMWMVHIERPSTRSGQIEVLRLPLCWAAGARLDLRTPISCFVDENLGLLHDWKSGFYRTWNRGEVCDSLCKDLQQESIHHNSTQVLSGGSIAGTCAELEPHLCRLGSSSSQDCG